MNIHSRQRLFTTILLTVLATLAFAQGENLDTVADTHHLAAYIVAGMLIGVFVMAFSNRLYYYREKDANREANQTNTQLGLVLNSTKTKIWTFNIPKHIYTTYSEKGKKKQEYQPMDFGQFFFNLEDFSRFRKEVLFPVRDGKETSGSILIRGKHNNEDGKESLYEVNLSVLKRNKHGKPSVLLGIQRDITEEREQQENSRILSLRYHTVFNSSQVDMIFYDADGVMIDINQQACETFAVGNREKVLAEKHNLSDVQAMEGIDFTKIDQLYSSSIMESAQVSNPIGEMEHWPEKIYYEQVMSPIYDNQGKMEGILMAGRNIAEMVQSQHYQKWASEKIAKASKEIQDYINNINYTLQVSGVLLINYHPDSHLLKVSSDLNETKYRLSQIRCASLIDQCDRRRVRGLFLRMDRYHQGIFNETLKTIFHDDQGRSIYLTFSVVPVTGKDGLVSHYFGMCRNDTEMTYTEARLREETLKARETEELKNTFLTNMSYEIRTPLNAVLGFAELFNAPHDESDEPVFAEEIRRNTGELLQLVNDILFISRLDANMVEYHYKECDFANLFEGYCYMGWSQLNPGVKVAVDNPYRHLTVTIDEQNLSMVIQKLCANASRHTTEGTIKAKYEYRHGELTISIEDTGSGMNEEVLKHVFERFTRNEQTQQYTTGLDMPIIKELTEQMGGTIEIQSEAGKGTTVYVILPCQMANMEKKSGII